MGWGWASRLGRFIPLGKTRYELHKKLCGPQGRSGQVRKISPGFDPRTVQTVASRYTDWATRPTGWYSDAVQSTIRVNVMWILYVITCCKLSNSVWSVLASVWSVLAGNLRQSRSRSPRTAVILLCLVPTVLTVQDCRKLWAWILTCNILVAVDIQSVLDRPRSPPCCPDATAVCWYIHGPLVEIDRRIKLESFSLSSRHQHFHGNVNILWVRKVAVHLVYGT
jgi:hypothetical protein